MTPFPRADYASLTLYQPDRQPVEVDLSDNTNLWGTHPAALERIRAVSEDELARYPELYADTLREAAAVRFGVTPEQVTTGAGSDDILDSAFRAAYRSNGVVAYAAPTFSMVEPLAVMNGMRAVATSWPDALAKPERLFVDDPAVVYVCRPNNPTGALAPREWIDRLLEIRAPAGRAGPLVVIDEAYADFAGESLVGRVTDHPGVLITRTTSKAYGLAGLRCGFGVAFPETTLAIEKSRGPYKVSRLAVEASTAALRDETGWMADTVATCITNRAKLRAELVERDLPPLDSSANFLLIPAPTGSARTDALAFRKRGIAVRPFPSMPDLGDGLRVTVGPWPLMEAFLSVLDELLSAGAPEGEGSR